MAATVTWNVSYDSVNDDFIIDEVMDTGTAELTIFYLDFSDTNTTFYTAEAHRLNLSNGGSFWSSLLQEQADDLDVGILWDYINNYFSEYSCQLAGYSETRELTHYSGVHTFTLDYSSSILTEYTIPYPALIYGTDFEHTIDASQLPVPGEFSVIEFSVTSEHPFLAGTGRMIFHSGEPNGIVYYSFDHSTGYTSLFYQTSGSTSSGGSFFGEMEVTYHWEFFQR